MRACKGSQLSLGEWLCERRRNVIPGNQQSVLELNKDTVMQARPSVAASFEMDLTWLQVTGMLHLRFIAMEPLLSLDVPDASSMEFIGHLSIALRPEEWATADLSSMAAFDKNPLSPCFRHNPSPDTWRP